MPQTKRVLSVFSLVMINVIAVDSLRTLPITAKLGFSLVFYYLIAAVSFFIPVALVAAELATAYPKTGGIYIWVREAFGRRAGFITIWLQWVYNIVWYPTIMAFIAATIAYLFSPSLADNKFYLLATITSLFWFFTIINCFGMKVSSIVSTIGAIVGTLLPMIGVIFLGSLWLIQGHPIQAMHPIQWLPDFSTLGNLSLFSAVLFGLLGMEMSAVHAEEVKNPQRDYPRALLYSTLLIFATLMFGSLAIVIVVPQTKLSLVSGLIDAYQIFFDTFHLSWMLPITAVCIVVGALSGVSAWIIGPTKGLLVAAQDKCLPEKFAQVNHHGAPVYILITQAIIFTILSCVLLFADSINVAYWILSDLCAQMALLVYVFMFAAAIKLKFKNPEQKGAYQVPGGRIALVFIAILGLICCLFAITIGFFPPTQLNIQHVGWYELFLVSGLSVFVIIPWLISKRISHH